MAKSKKSKSLPSDFSFFDLDPNKLDEHWLEHPGIYWRLARDHADLKNEMERAKSQIDVVSAEVAKAVREDPEEYDIEKVTEKAIDQAVAVSDELAEAKEEYHRLRHEVDIMTAAITAMEHRKRALEGLVSLHGQNYFSAPRAPKGSEEAIEEMERTSQSRRTKPKLKRNRK